MVTLSLENGIKVVMFLMTLFVCVLPDIYFMVEAARPSQQVCEE